MARNSKDILISAQNRDQGKLFRVTEMGAADAEDWAFRALKAVAASGVDIPADPKSLAASKLASVGLEALAKADTEVVRELMREMLKCISVVSAVDVTLSTPFVPNLHVEEVSTLITLRAAVLELHLGFFMGANPLTSA